MSSGRRARCVVTGPAARALLCVLLPLGAVSCSSARRAPCAGNPAALDCAPAESESAWPTARTMAFFPAQDRYAAPVFSGELADFDFREIELRDAIDTVAARFGVSYVIGPDLGRQRLSIRLRDTPWDVALLQLLESGELEAQSQGGILIVATKAQWRSRREQAASTASGAHLEDTVWEVFPMPRPRGRTIESEELVTLVQQVLSPRGRAFVHAPSGHLLVKDIKLGRIRAEALQHALENGEELDLGVIRSIDFSRPPGAELQRGLGSIPEQEYARSANGLRSRITLSGKDVPVGHALASIFRELDADHLISDVRAPVSYRFYGATGDAAVTAIGQVAGLSLTYDGLRYFVDGPGTTVSRHLGGPMCGELQIEVRQVGFRTRYFPPSSLLAIAREEAATSPYGNVVAEDSAEMVLFTGALRQIAEFRTLLHLLERPFRRKG